MPGPLLAYEVLTAFFLEATFLGVMLFGWRRISPGMHFAYITTYFVIGGDSAAHLLRDRHREGRSRW